MNANRPSRSKGLFVLHTFVNWSSSACSFNTVSILTCPPEEMATHHMNPLAQAGQIIQQCQSAVMQHPWAQQLDTNIKQWKRQHHKRMRALGHRNEMSPPTIIVPPRAGQFAAIIPGDSVAEAVLSTGFLNFLNLYNSALIVRLVLTWFPNPPAFIEQPLQTVCDPYLNLFRGLIPPLGGTLDFSPILAFVVLNLFTNTAAALPCEVGPDGKPIVTRQEPSGPMAWLQPSKYQQIWSRRVQAQKSGAQEDEGCPKA